MEGRGLKISRKKTAYLGYVQCNKDAEIHSQGDTVKSVRAFTYLGSTLEYSTIHQAPINMATCARTQIYTHIHTHKPPRAGAQTLILSFNYTEHTITNSHCQF